MLAGTAVAPPPPHRGHYCELCESDCSGQHQLEQHLRGERHRSVVRRLERELAGCPALECGDVNPYNLPQLWLAQRRHCNLCDVAITSLLLAKVHFSSRIHRAAAGLHLLPAHQEEQEEAGEGPRCDTCDFRASSASSLLSHEAGVRHQENERTRTAVEASGGEWKAHTPQPPDPPRHSVEWQPVWEGGWGAARGAGGWPPPGPWLGPGQVQEVPPPLPWDPVLTQTPGHPFHCGVCRSLLSLQIMIVTVSAAAPGWPV